MAEEVITQADLDEHPDKKFLVMTPIFQFEYTGVDCNEINRIIKVEQDAIVSEEINVTNLDLSLKSNNNLSNTADATDYAIKSEYETVLFTDKKPYHIRTTIKTEHLDEEQTDDDSLYADCDYDNFELCSIIKTEPETIQSNRSHRLLAGTVALQKTEDKHQLYDFDPPKRPALRRTYGAKIKKNSKSDQSLSKCVLCEAPFTENYTQDLHVCFASKTITSYKCHVCNHSFRTKNTLDRHYQTHTGTGKFQCNVCLKCFKWKGNLITHFETHSGLKPFKCNVCKKCFNCKSNLKRHKLKHSVKSFKCDECDTFFTRKDSLRTHMLIHTGEKKFKCDVCHLKFLRQAALDTHSLSHLISSLSHGNTKDCGERSRCHKCYKCEKMFFTKQQLLRHSHQHTGVKPFKCHVCDKSFTRKDTLQGHLYLHTDVSPYQCKICDKYLVKKSALDIHVRNHTRSA